MMARRPKKTKTPSRPEQPVGKPEPVSEGTRSFPVVGVGASAGGLDALAQLLRPLPVDTGMALVLIQHLDPTHESMLSEILSRVTRMPVLEVKDEPLVMPNHVYVIPPGRNMTIQSGHLKLEGRPETRAKYRPVDVFLRALAEDQGHRGIGVILSGTGNDGTLGLEDIKAEGGITFAQDHTAQYDGMPRSAIAAGCVDFVLPPEKIAEELARIARHPAATATDVPVAHESTVNKILRVLHDATGVDFTHYKSTTLYRRISRRMLLHKLEGLPDYVRFLQGNPAELQSLYQDVLISVTSFFRDPEAFETLKAKVFSKMLKERSRQDAARIWTLGCSTGEEAYSLAIALCEFCAENGIQVPMQVFGTDLNEQGIDKARAGWYSKNIATDVSPERLERFFVETGGGYQVAKTIRDMCVFARQNVVADPPFSRLDLISCRNMLIYMEPTLQRKVLPVFHYALKPKGYLWLGTSESIGTFSDLFEVADSKHKVYVKKGGAKHYQHVLPIVAPAWEVAGRERPARRVEVEVGVDAQREADRMAVARYAPPGVLVNADLDIVQFRGDTSPYLAPAPGRPNVNVLKMAREGLLVGLRSALQNAMKQGQAVQMEGLRVRSNGGMREVDLAVLPVQTDVTKEQCYLVLFEEPRGGGARPVARKEKPARAAKGRTSAAAEHEIVHLTQELAATREYLQSQVEQKEAVNEELQSANEEIQSSNEELQSVNEELQTTKEEIQSSNEELATVNEELRHRNEELDQANNDLLNFLANTQLALVMVGPDLGIRQFTPAAEKVLNLIASDVGRPIGDINLPLAIESLEQLLLDVLATGEVQEQEVEDKRGRWHLLRIRPYSTAERKIEGAVMVLIDFDAQKRAIDSLAESDRRKEELLAMLAHELRNPLAPLVNGLELLISAPIEPSERTHIYESMQRQARKISRLVDDLVDASRIRQGKIELQEQVVELRDVVAQAIEAAHGIGERRHELSVQLPDAPLHAKGDPVRLEQVFSNLIGNAAKFTNPGGHIWVTLRREAQSAVIRVRDDGIGISPAILPHVFDLFVQGDSSYGRERGGLGIGLALVRQLVAAHGGSVEAHSGGLMQGSELVVRLPLVSESEVPSSAQPARQPRESGDGSHVAQFEKTTDRLSGLRVVLVDDNPDAADSLAALLRLHGCDVRVAHSGPGAIDLVEEFQPQAALVDIGLPGMDGYEVARELRERSPSPVFVVAVSGYGQEQVVDRSAAEGFNGHLVKPASVQSLVALLDSVPRPR